MRSCAGTALATASDVTQRPSFSTAPGSTAPTTAAEVVRSSWQRCAQLGLSEGTRTADVVASRDDLVDRLEANTCLITFAQPVIEHLHQQIARSSSMVLLADRDGTILRAVGDSDFVDRAARIALAPGAIWAERIVGTNAIGTALHDGQTVAIIGEEHYFERNRFLTCIAAPILAPTGGVLGILDISSDARVAQTHARALLNTTVEMIENRLIEAVSEAFVEIHFHPSVEMLSTPLAGLALFDEAGNLRCCNRRARALFGADPTRGEPEGGRFGQYFLDNWAQVVDHAFRRPDRTIKLRTGSGRELAALLHMRKHETATRPQTSTTTPGIATSVPYSGQPASPPFASSSPTDSALSALDLGDPQIAEAIRRVRRIAQRDIPLLIQGETGTGKEIFARAYHAATPRGQGPFVAVNCAAVPAGLIEAELFGYAPGAFTGASAQGRKGRLREAHGGTLLLDEVGDMPPNLQASLLRVLETRRVAPLGDSNEETIDVSLICATHRPLRELVDLGHFRSDLYFRLSGMMIVLPPLRERSDFDALVGQIAREEGLPESAVISEEAFELLRRHRWPGNLRQLRNALRLAVALKENGSGELRPEHLPVEMLEDDSAAGEDRAVSTDLRANELRMVRSAVSRHGGNISAAARELGITRTTLYRKLRKGDGH